MHFGEDMEPRETDQYLEIHRHDKHQKDTLTFSREVIKTFLLLSGGALVTCATFFSDKPHMAASIVKPARFAWVCLTAAILLLSMTLISIISRDYQVGEHWRVRIEENVDREDWKYWDVVIWFFGLVGSLAFAVGLISFAVAAWTYLGQGDISIPLRLP